VISFNRHVSVQ